MWIYWFWTECLTTHRLVALQCYCFEVCMCVCLCGIILLSQGIITWLVSFLLIGRENWKRQEPEFQSSEWKTHGERQRKGVSGTERERERDWLNLVQCKRGSTFTPFRGLTGKERNTQSDTIFSHSKAAGFSVRGFSETQKHVQLNPTTTFQQEGIGETPEVRCCWFVCMCVWMCLSVAIWSESLVYRLTLVSLPLNRLCCSSLNPVL